MDLLYAAEGAVSRGSRGPVTRQPSFVIVSLEKTARNTSRIMLDRLTLSLLGLSYAIAGCGGEPAAEQAAEAAPVAAPGAPAASSVRTGDPAARGYTEADFPRVQEIAPGVFTYEALATVGGSRITTNSFFVVTSEGVLVSDGQRDEEETERLIAAIAERSGGQPIRTVVIGSDHQDHSGGSLAFPAGATFLAHPHSIARLRERGGAPANLQPLESEQTITMGGRTIRVMHLGRAHTGGDLMVYLPQERVLHTSEVFLNHIFPSLGDSYPREWVATLTAARALDVAVFVPGHGFVDPPAVLTEEIATFQGALETMIAAVEGVHDEGAAVEEALGRAQFGDASTWVRAESMREPAIRRIYSDLNEELPTP
jgi:cyclase